MTVTRNLFPNHATDHFTGTNNASGLEHGLNWSPLTNAKLTQIWWWRDSTTAGNKPTQLRVWDRATGQNIAPVPDIPDNGAVGWQTYTLLNKVQLVAGRVYSVSGYWPANTGYPQYIGLHPQTVDYPLIIGTPQRSTGAANSATFPNTTNDNAASWGLDVTVEFDDPDAPPAATSTDIEASLTSWLSSTANDHPLTGIPYLLYGLVQTIKTTLDTAAAKVASNEDAIAAALGPGGAMVTGAARTILDNHRDELAKVLDLADSVLKTKLDAITTDTGDIKSLLANPVTPEPPTSETAEWIITASGSESGQATITDPADFYNITITDYGAENRVRAYAGQDFLSFAWWVAPLRGGASGSYQTYRSLSADVYEPGRRLPGLLVVVPNDFDWTWEAWSYVVP